MDYIIAQDKKLLRTILISGNSLEQKLAQDILNLKKELDNKEMEVDQYREVAEESTRILQNIKSRLGGLKSKRSVESV